MEIFFSSVEFFQIAHLFTLPHPTIPSKDFFLTPPGFTSNLKNHAIKEADIGDFHLIPVGYIIVLFGPTCMKLDAHPQF